MDARFAGIGDASRHTMLVTAFVQLPSVTPTDADQVEQRLSETIQRQLSQQLPHVDVLVDVTALAS